MVYHKRAALLQRKETPSFTNSNNRLQYPDDNEYPELWSGSLARGPIRPHKQTFVQSSGRLLIPKLDHVDDSSSHALLIAKLNCDTRLAYAFNATGEHNCRNKNLLVLAVRLHDELLYVRGLLPVQRQLRRAERPPLSMLLLVEDLALHGSRYHRLNWAKRFCLLNRRGRRARVLNGRLS